MTAETLSLKINSAAIDDRPVKDIQRTESSQDFAAIHNALPQVAWHIET